MTAERWWREGVIYQVYPRSFQDSDGDGVGDLQGIRQRLPHLTALGVDALWLSPMYPSPMADFGYDVADYCDVAPLFGTLTDFDALLADAHRLGLKLILDLVPNHSSDRHPWFLQSRSSRDDPKRDWYIWRDPAPDSGPPNNWLSNFGGPAWTFDAATGQYWLHSFLSAQPDLNWRNPAVQAAIHDVMRFWFERGVDGFRIDVVDHLVKDDQFRDNPRNPDFRLGDDPAHRVLPVYTKDRPEMMAVIAGLRAVADAYSTPESARALIGEAYLPFDRLVRYYGVAMPGLHMPFNFHLIGTPWNASAIARVVRDYEAALPPNAAPNWVLGNHDKPRIASRVGPHGARLAAMLLLTLRGTPTLYYGDEIGMQDVPIPPDEVQDPFEQRVPDKGLGRDPQRTPMRWSGEAPNAGFTTGRPWLRMGDGLADCNVAAEGADPRSMLCLHQRLLALRRSSPALRTGGYRQIAVVGGLLVFLRGSGAEAVTVALNFGDCAVDVPPATLPTAAMVLLSTCLDRHGRVADALVLRPFEGVLLASDQGFASVV